MSCTARCATPSNAEAMPDCAKFRYAPLQNIELLREISDGATMAGASSAIPGAELGGDEGANIVDVGDDGSNDAEDDTTHDVGGAKVAKKQPKGPVKRKDASISPSRKKHKKNPMDRGLAREFRRLVDLLETSISMTSTRAPPEIMDLVVQSGAGEGSDEHFIAAKLFIKQEYREVFLTIKTNQGRLAWLKRMWECMQDKSIPEIMDLVLQSGAVEGSDEHFIATNLFIKREYRKMFLTLKTNQERLAWLKRTWEEKTKH